MTRLSLPVDAVLPELIARLRRNSGCVLTAPTGAGKTTRVPPALLDAGLAGAGSIVMLEPRRLATQAAARRIAAERGGKVGDEVGYQIRFDRKASVATHIFVVTEGILVRMLQDDPFLERVGLVIFDEFHERNLNSDLSLAMTRRVQREARPELKIVVMSATLDAEPVAAFLGCPVLRSEGRLHPVDVRFSRFSQAGPIHESAAAGVEQILDETAGDVLVFLPGVGEIRRTKQQLSATAARRNLALMELYADLPPDEQDAALRLADRRKIVLATNVAETSVTIEGVTAVVDTGLARVPRFDPAVGLDRLEVCRISRSSADQRAGRAGRTTPGVCLRLWTEREHESLETHEEPEIRRLDLAGPALELRAWGEPDLRAFPWYEAPAESAIEHAESLLRLLGAIDTRGVTELGRRMARLPVHPRLARLLIEGHARGCVERAALVAALLSERTAFQRPRERREVAHSSDSDVLDRLQALESFANARRRHSEVGTLETGPAQFVLRAAEQLTRAAQELGGRGRAPRGSKTSSDDSLLESLWTAFPDRLARRREQGSPRAVMVGGRGVRLADESAVARPDLFVCVDVEEVGKSEALVRQASVVERDWLPAGALTTRVDVEFDERRERVIATRRVRYLDLAVEESATDVPDSPEVADLLAREAAKRLDRAIALDDSGVAQFFARANSLREWLPELALPAFDETTLREILPQLCAGRRSFQELRQAPLIEFLKSRLTPAQLQSLDRDAPERITVPSGSRVALCYEPGRPPVLAVRIQEVFGLRETPRVARGRVAVLMHLLAPNMRPQQVTDDLASFWMNVYPAVRKELCRRYPRHAWPIDPFVAAAQRRPRRKGGDK